MEPLDQLVSKLELAFSGRLVSVVLYGSAASGQTDTFSDLNVLCVLKEITPKELAAGEPVLRWWSDQGHPSPLLLSEEEVSHSADCFAIEFRDMQERRKILFGTDPIAHLNVENTHYRTQVEHQLRAGLLRLRQRGAGILSDSPALLRLCADSVSTFCVLGRHALLLAGKKPDHDRRKMVHQLGNALGVEMTPFASLLDLRESKSPGAHVDALELFAKYLVSIQRLIVFVDGLKQG